MALVADIFEATLRHALRFKGCPTARLTTWPYWRSDLSPPTDGGQPVGEEKRKVAFIQSFGDLHPGSCSVDLSAEDVTMDV